MNSIFFTQNESALIPPLLIINGVVYKVKPLPTEVKPKLSFLMNYLKRNGLSRHSFEKMQTRYKLSNNFIIKKGKNDFFVQSTFLETDIEGRNMAFSFWCDDDDIDRIISLLKNCAAISCRTLRKNEIEVLPELIKSLERKNKNIYYIIIAAFIFIVLLLFYSAF